MITPGRKYTLEEVEQIRTQYPDLRMPGMVTRANDDGTIQFLPWHEGTGGGGTFGGLAEAPDRMFTPVSDNPYGELPKREKREPLVQLQSLMDRVRPDFMAGRILSADQVATYTSKARAKELRAGAALTEADLHDVMKSFIHRAEKENEARESRQIVRTSRAD